MTIYVATSNPGKLRDFAWAAAEFSGHFRIEPLPRLKEIAAPPENEPTFEGNARAKALFYAAFVPGELVLADDSGLEVGCLRGAPGVRSARYAEDQGFPHPPAATHDERNNAALLRAMDAIPAAGRDGRYRCALALARGGEIVSSADGILEGTILSAPRGSGGFGYDPLFFIAEAGKTMAEIGPESRFQFSHRGRALRTLLSQLAANGPNS